MEAGDTLNTFSIIKPVFSNWVMFTIPANMFLIIQQDFNIQPRVVARDVGSETNFNTVSHLKAKLLCGLHKIAA